jgi:hypothetical protein
MFINIIKQLKKEAEQVTLLSQPTKPIVYENQTKHKISKYNN